ncbi:MAG: RagB/SusD family nutrient uptake outer membrane protein [Balneolales bacterium]
MKNTKKQTKHLIICWVILIFASGCEDFLTQTDPTSFTMNNYYTQPEHAESAVNAIYQDLRAVRGGGFNGAAWMMTEFQTGLANTELGQADNSIIIRNLQNNSDNGYGNSYWNSHYQGIANANVAIENIPNVEMNEDQKNRLLGEARFLRALYYYNLVRLFGEIPLVLEPINLNSDDFYPEQASIADIYDAIVADLIWSETSGLPSIDENGKVSLGATKSLLSSVYLTMAGFPLNGGSTYYELARDKAEEVMISDDYYLFDSYADLRSNETKNIGEHIFMVQFDRNISNHNGLQYVLIPYNQGVSLYSAETGGIFAQREFVESYEEGDKRTEEKQFYYRSFTTVADRSVTIDDLGGWYIYKWMDPEAHVTTAMSDLNWPELRYAEILLIYAEAANEVDGPTGAAYEAVNAVRTRAELPDLSGLSQEEFREAIWKERFHELSFENKTWYDMVRLRKALNTNTGEFEDYVGHTFVYGPTLQERELLFPIPANEIRNNENLTQNPGY